MAPHAEELSRKISQIDLTSIRSTKDTLPEFGPADPKNEMLKLRQETHDGHVDTPDYKYEGVMTPGSLPAAPPTTPADKTPGGQTEEEDGGLALLDRKKKKKSGSGGGGKSKKTPATGFEGLCRLPNPEINAEIYS